MTDAVPRLASALADRYTIDRQLGAGGMATVYLAGDLKHDRKVAIKVLRPELAAVLGAERFVQEIKTTASLQHPHILPLHDSGEADGFLYYVMPYIEGETLRDKLDRETQLGIEEAVRITTEVADALDYAHRNGVIHRDIKPENILLHDGRPMVADFGIALAVSAAAGGRMTETGLSLGTPHYMSPEQATAEKDITNKSDIYSLGAVLYEMLAGNPPHTGSSAQQVIAKIVADEARPVGELRKTVPPNITAALAVSLEKLPADRFGTASAFAAALNDPSPIARAVGTHRVPPRTSVWPWRAVLSVGVVGVAGLVVGLLLGRGTAARFDDRVVRLEVADNLQSVGEDCCGTGLALSPDGRTLAYSRRSSSGDIALAIRTLDNQTVRELEGTGGATAPFFSPDGRWLGFAQGGLIRKMSLAGGTPITVVHVGDQIRGAHWGRNDTIIYSNDEDDKLYRVAASGGTPERMAGGPEAVFHRNPSFLPDGRRVLFAIDDPGPITEIRLAILDLATGTIDTLDTPGTMGRYALSGHLVFTTANGALMAQPFDLARARPTESPVALANDVRLRFSGTAEFAISESGDLVYVPSSAASSDRLVLVAGAARRDLPLPAGLDLEHVAVSPDGRRIAVQIVEGERRDIWVFDREQGTRTRLTTATGTAGVPVWAPDGRRIGYNAQTGSTPSGVFSRASDGSGAVELHRAHTQGVQPAAFTPDGGTMIIQEFRDGSMDIGALGIGDSTVRWLAASEFEERQARLSPDGRWVAYSSNRSGVTAVYVQAFSGDGGVYQVSTDAGHSPEWSPDGRTVYYGTGQTIVAAAVDVSDDLRVVSRSIAFEGNIDFDPGNTNYDVHPVTGELLVILESGHRAPIHWVLGWPSILRGVEPSP